MVPNHGLSSRASRRAGMRSSTSRASASRARTSSGARSAGASSVRVPSAVPLAVASSAMDLSDHVPDARHAVAPRPPLQLVPHPAGRPRVGEGGRAHLHRGRPGQQHLGRVGAVGHAPHADDRQRPAPPRGRRTPPAPRPGGSRGPTAPPPRGPDPSRKRRVSGSMAMPITVFTRVTASAPASCGGARDLGEVRHVGAELGPSGPPAPGGGPQHVGRGLGRVGEQVAPGLGVGARQVDLDGDDARRARRPAGRPPAGTRRPCGPRSRPRRGRRWRAAAAGRRPARRRRRGPGGPPS